MADAVERKAKHTDSFSKWVASPRAASNPVELRKRQELWDALNTYVREAGGWIVSVPGLKELRIEAPQGSTLASKLTALGYTIRLCGSDTRLVPGGTVETIVAHGTGAPIIRHHAGFIPIDILEIELSRR
jgi:hypothetical protein